VIWNYVKKCLTATVYVNKEEARVFIYSNFSGDKTYERLSGWPMKSISIITNIAYLILIES
jgi:hypothetical protein